MDYIIDKTIVLILCCGLMVLTGITMPAVIAMLTAISLSALFELPVSHMWLRRACPLLYCLLILAVPDFVVFLPLAAGDLFRLRLPWLRFLWAVPLFIVVLMPGSYAIYTLPVSGAALLCVLSCLLSWRGERVAEQREVARTERDTLAQASYSLELRNRDMQERQELELRLATLNERSRIAREIHDNVGHLLTRLVLQVKALTVVHADNKKLASELGHVSSTLDEAFETVRASVHDLHEDVYSLEVQLKNLTYMHETLQIEVDYRAEELPSHVAYSFLAIIREALSNTERHSDATCARVTVVEFPGLYQLSIHDNGSKPTLDTVRTEGKGIGLTNMEERARALGGIFRSSYDNGFKVFVSVPKKERE